MSGVLYYALGGGHGHALRGIAVLRRLRELAPRRPAALLVPRRLAAWARREGFRTLSPPGDRPGRAELARFLAEALRAEAPERLLVDVFPRGVLGELTPLLAGLPRPPWLVARRVRADYYLSDGVRDALEQRFERVIWCEEPPPELAALALRQERVGPVLVRRPAECLDRNGARAALGAAPGEPLVVALASGDRRRQRDLLRLLSKIQRREGRFRLAFLSDVIPPSRRPGLTVEPVYPAMAYLAAADLAVAAGGYAAFHETAALGVPAVYLPQRRRYDDQRWRVRDRPTAASPEQLAEALRRGLAALTRPAPPPPQDDGAARIARALLAALTATTACT